MVNQGNETRITRRIIAEDADWTLQTVPYLRQLSLNAIVSNWDAFPYINELPSEKERTFIMNRFEIS